MSDRKIVNIDKLVEIQGSCMEMRGLLVMAATFIRSTQNEDRVPSAADAESVAFLLDRAGDRAETLFDGMF